MQFDELKNIKLPRHIAFIMDGNGRWATKRNKSRKEGHKAGVKVMENIVEFLFSLGVEFVTVFAFSTENWSRPKDEIDALFNLIDIYVTRLSKNNKNKIRFNFLGDTSKFPQELKAKIDKLQNETLSFTKVMNICLNYGGKDEIIRAVNLAVEAGTKVDDASFRSLLYTGDMPDPDLLIRTSGEMRISNFLLYQIAYSEMYFSNSLWPDFNQEEMAQILLNYASRKRTFGKVK